MIKFNNKGQSLVLFIIFIPVLLGIMALVIDVGNALIKKSETDDVLELVLNYGLKNDEVFFENQKEELVTLLNYNLSDSSNEIILKDKQIIISSECYVEGIFSNILNIKGFKIESEYIGYIDSEKKFEKIK